MSIAINVFAPGSISSYADLYDEICDLMDDEAYSRDAFDRALRKSEAMFERTLRAPEMEARETFLLTAEIAPLPERFLQMRYIYQDGQPDSPLKSMSPAGLLSGYGGVSGVPQAYAIEGREIRIAPVGNTRLEMLYYERLPQLTEDFVSTWLLDRHPDLYVAGIMYHLARRERDSEGAAQALAEVSEMIDTINSATTRARWGAGPLIPAGMRQIAGVRA